MDNSLKIGAVSGLIAGFVNGTVYEISARIAVLIGLINNVGGVPYSRIIQFLSSWISNNIVTPIVATRRITIVP